MATRKEIRVAVADRIEPLVTKAFPGWMPEADPRDFPLALVYFDGGSPEAVHSDEYETTAVLNIDIWDKDATNLDDTLDLLGNQIKAAIETDSTFAGLIDGMYQTEFSYDRDPDSFAGVLNLTFNVIYQDED